MNLDELLGNGIKFKQEPMLILDAYEENGTCLMKLFPMKYIDNTTSIITRNCKRIRTAALPMNLLSARLLWNHYTIIKSVGILKSEELYSIIRREEESK